MLDQFVTAAAEVANYVEPVTQFLGGVLIVAVFYHAGRMLVEDTLRGIKEGAAKEKRRQQRLKSNGMTPP